MNLASVVKYGIIFFAIGAIFWAVMLSILLIRERLKRRKITKQLLAEPKYDNVVDFLLDKIMVDVEWMIGTPQLNTDRMISVLSKVKDLSLFKSLNDYDKSMLAQRVRARIRLYMYVPLALQHKVEQLADQAEAAILNNSNQI